MCSDGGMSRDSKGLRRCCCVSDCCNMNGLCVCPEEDREACTCSHPPGPQQRETKMNDYIWYDPEDVVIVRTEEGGPAIAYGVKRAP